MVDRCGKNQRTDLAASSLGGIARVQRRRHLRLGRQDDFELRALAIGVAVVAGQSHGWGALLCPGEATELGCPKITERIAVAFLSYLSEGDHNSGHTDIFECGLVLYDEGFPLPTLAQNAC